MPIILQSGKTIYYYVDWNLKLREQGLLFNRCKNTKKIVYCVTKI